MQPPSDACGAAKGERNDECGGGAALLTLDADEEAADGVGHFDLLKAVCSHGFFMMAPNQWDAASKTLRRPLRLDPNTSVFVSISQPHPRPSPLHISVSPPPLSPHHRRAILAQVRRMLRLSSEENTSLMEFHKVHPTAAEKGLGRIFRSPTLFEDMVKCILLCNCQWSRTLSMARALCELQWELKNDILVQDFQPKTPIKKDLKRKALRKRKFQMNLETVFTASEEDILVSVENNSSSQVKHTEWMKKEPNLFEPIGQNSDAFSTSHQLPNIISKVGNFPSPEELANLTEELLAKRCGLGYRAKRILLLAKSVVEKKVQLEELEQLCDVSSHESYTKITQRLLAFDGFGPFTCANVLMCMGYYHKIPSDSETIRHLKQIHSKSCTMKSIDDDLEQIYGKYAPFQFLAYWIELWEFYERMFGKSSEMSWNDYQLITASNMKIKKSR